MLPCLAAHYCLQERLTRTIAEAHKRTHGQAQEWVRAMLTTVGRGGDGQRIRWGCSAQQLTHGLCAKWGVATPAQ